ncbi:acyl-coenzyme A thioesterase 13-like [Macadamia integrifolia]|uniref:acyl-coenzyme A thioesterase 13-like n=1 Tax=Macadamia integrifolia TaxID=60698 RepID=UPI001C4EDC96|nr:acyl-coenzyme A thioesterase 13-like [Macadamia integrifolia]
MDLDSVKRLLEREGEENESASIDAVPNKLPFFDRFILQGIQLDVIEPGRLVCSMKVPRSLVNSDNFLHGGVTGTLVDIVGALTMETVGAHETGVSVEINITYLDAAFPDEEIEVVGEVLRVGKAIGVVSVELRNKKTGKIFAQGHHTKYPVASSKL